MKKKLRKALIAALSASMLMPSAVSASSVYYKDVTSKFEWARQAIDTLSEAGVLTGYSDGYFRPAYSIRRCDFLIMLYKSFGSEGTYLSALPYDVPKGIYYEQAYKWAVSKNLFKAETAFRPNDPVTRQDAFYCLAKCLEEKGYITDSNRKNNLQGFGDSAAVDRDKVEAIATLVSLGVVSGKDGLVAPKEALTRAEMALIFYNTAQLDTDSAFDGILKNVSANFDIPTADTKYNIKTSAESKYVIDGTEAVISDENISVGENGKSAVIVQNGGKLDLNNVKINKTGDAPSSVNTGISGLNSAITVRQASTANISGADISTMATYSNGITSIGNGNRLNISDTKIKTSRYTNSNPIAVSGNAQLKLENCIVDSSADEIPAVYVDGSNSRTDITGGSLVSSGDKAAAVKSNGRLSLDGVTVKSEKGKGVVSLGNGELYINNTTIDSEDSLVEIELERTKNSEYRQMNYTSITNSDLTSDSGQTLIETTNINADIYISGCQLSTTGAIYKNRKDAGRNATAKGYEVTLTFDNQEGEGTIETISNAPITLILKNASHLKTAINNQQPGPVDVVLTSSDDTLELTGDCYLRSIQNHDDYSFYNIKDNGYSIYYDNTDANNAWLHDENFPLQNGGSIIPLY